VADHAPVAREVEPWGLVNARGVWYLVGLDKDRGAERTFRLSRIVGAVAAVGRAGTVTIPADIDLQRSVANGSDEAGSAAALLRVRAGRAAGLRRVATNVQPVGTGEYDDIHVPMASLTDLARRVAAQGPDVIVVDPAELRDTVRTLLREAVEQR
jgi:proteasome accessory factor B